MFFYFCQGRLTVHFTLGESGFPFTLQSRKQRNYEKEHTKKWVVISIKFVLKHVSTLYLYVSKDVIYIKNYFITKKWCEYFWYINDNFWYKVCNKWYKVIQKLYGNDNFIFLQYPRNRWQGSLWITGFSATYKIKVATFAQVAGEHSPIFNLWWSLITSSDAYQKCHN